jgi:hypothetical protein
MMVMWTMSLLLCEQVPKDDPKDNWTGNTC